MSRSVTIIMCVLCVTLSNAEKKSRFTTLWYDGNAEIAVYSLTESRYGEMREGRRIMVFVTEPLRRSTLVKPDNRLPDDSIVRVIKCNDLREFFTGIYNYNVMTSVFQAVEKSGPYNIGDAVKVALSSQEWCGMVYDRMLLRKNGYTGMLYSYFEKESEHPYSIPVDGHPVPEENLWLMVRELNGELCATGTEKKITLVPSMWHRRKTHTPVTTVPAMITKGKPMEFRSVLGTIPAVPFTWKAGTATTSVTVEVAWPHRILAFEEPDGSHGELLSVRRLPYWKLHDNDDLHFRRELGLNSTMPAPEKK
jgi:hypothetical protein